MLKKYEPIFYLPLKENEARELYWLLGEHCTSKALGVIHRRLEKIVEKFPPRIKPTTHFIPEG